ncbi:PilZ domain-containing protein [Atopomonas sediminilitoris]|uniref:PilZ domain-containing protein n=1 Tax=Atopomonas sediminilitoris TaxID=2919919 RepID=UPI001F4DFDAC|nr:PilZ domain-containing protein [Atopomonas sediminilitoris]MCJ8169281.1 PilZ domain-containing protein [Atopomonas sediminilitoris]
MNLQSLHLDVPELLPHNPHSLNEWVDAVQALPEQDDRNLARITHEINQTPLNLLERQRLLQQLTDRFAKRSHQLDDRAPNETLLDWSEHLATGYKRLLLQILQGRQPSQAHLAWCLFMIMQFLVQSILRHLQRYQEPHSGLWRDCHLIYLLAEHRECLDEPLSVPFTPTPASSLRGAYQQALLLALSSPFHLSSHELHQLFTALAPLAAQARLEPFSPHISTGPWVDMGGTGPKRQLQDIDEHDQSLRQLNLAAVLVTAKQHAPLRSDEQNRLLIHAQKHWLNSEQRQHERQDRETPCSLIMGLNAIHNQLGNGQSPLLDGVLCDTSPGGARLRLAAASLHMPVGQLVLMTTGNLRVLALVQWRHQDSQTLHVGLRYLKGSVRAGLVRRTPETRAHQALLLSTPQPGQNWEHTLWLNAGEFTLQEDVFLQLENHANQAIHLATPTHSTRWVSRHPLTL